MEQIIYLIALKRLDTIETTSAKGAAPAGISAAGSGPNMRWPALVKMKSQSARWELFQKSVFPYLKSVDAFGLSFRLAMLDAVCGITQPKVLEEAVRLVDQLPVSDEDIDVQGDIYEELLAQVSFAGKHTQFLTPRHIIRTMVEMSNPQLGEMICDPAAGTGGFLIAAHQWILKTHTLATKVRVQPDGAWHNLSGELLPKRAGKSVPHHSKYLVGFDFDTTMVRLGLMNMMLHGIPRPEYYRRDSLNGAMASEQFNLILSYLPFGGIVEKRAIDRKLLKLPTDKTELLFVELCLALLKKRGRCAVIVPESVAINTDPECVELRKQIIKQHKLEAVISLPRGCFLPYTASKTAILLMRKEAVTDQVWFYEVTGDGYSLDDKREPDPENNDLSLVPQAYRAIVLGDEKAWKSRAAKAKAEQRSLIVKQKEIIEQDFSLSIGLYRKSSAVEQEHEDPNAVIKRVLSLQSEIRRKVKEIETKMAEVIDA
jgi:type I restriction enzyme M protein